MREKRDPTHTLVFEVPLYLSEDDKPRFDPVQDAVRLLFGASRLAAEDLVCGEPMVTLRKEQS